MAQAVVANVFRVQARFLGVERAVPGYTHPRPSGRPVLAMVHGFQGSVSELAPLYTRLRETVGDAWDIAVVDTLDPWLYESPDDGAAALDDFLHTHGLHGPPLALIGYSAGGILARRYCWWPGAPPIRALALVGCPNGGVRAFNYLPIHWLAQHGFDKRINEPYPLRAQIPHLIVAGTRGANHFESRPNDRVVSLRSVQSARAEPGTSVDMRTVHCGHWDLLRSPEVAEMVTTFLRAARPVEPA
jgi:pimeloyl-ACP methyl ester carboxylesterase